MYTFVIFVTICWHSECQSTDIEKMPFESKANCEMYLKHNQLYIPDMQPGQIIHATCQPRKVSNGTHPIP